MNKQEIEKEIGKIIHNGGYTTMDIILNITDWHINKQIELLNDMKTEMCLSVYNTIDKKIIELKSIMA